MSFKVYEMLFATVETPEILFTYPLSRQISDIVKQLQVLRLSPRFF
jgi:hypothetical protein